MVVEEKTNLFKENKRCSQLLSLFYIAIRVLDKKGIIEGKRAREAELEACLMCKMQEVKLFLGEEGSRALGGLIATSPKKSNQRRFEVDASGHYPRAGGTGLGCI